MRVFWGLLILTFGLIFLGLSFNLWGASQIEELAQFWPLLLILFGISIIVRHLKFGWLIVLLSFLAAILFVYFFSFVPGTSKSNIFNQKIETYNFSSDLPQDVKQAKIIIDTGAVSLNASKTSDKLIEGSLESRYFQPELDVTSENGTVTAHLKTIRFGGWWGKNNLTLQITDKIPVEVVINSGASSINLDLTNISISNLEVNAGASSIDVKIGNIQNNAKVSISAGASTIDLQIPKDYGVKLISKTGLSSKSYEGFTQIEKDAYQNENYNKDDVNKLEVNLDAGVSSIKLETY